MSQNRAFENWQYYRDNIERRREYFKRHHAEWKNMKKFADATGMKLGDARNYIDKKLKSWYLEVGILKSLPKSSPRKRIRVWVGHLD